MSRHFKGGIFLKLNFAASTLKKNAKKITCPLQAIQDQGDRYSTMAQIEGLGDFCSKKGHSPAHNIRRLLLNIEQFGHSSHCDQADAVIEAMHQFLREVPKR